MKVYRNVNGDSNVESYDIGDDFIVVRFRGSYRDYKYSYQKAGQHHVEQMKRLAQRGAGLNSYINRYVRKCYD